MTRTFAVLGPEVPDPAMRFARYSWPTEYVARAIKEVGWQNFSLDRARAPLANMGQLLFEPPNVRGWEGGRAWINTNTVFARDNFAVLLFAPPGRAAAKRQSQSCNLGGDQGRAQSHGHEPLDQIYLPDGIYEHAG